MKNLIIILAIALSNTCSAQLYQIGHMSITITDSTRNNRSIPLEIYYPADSSGNNVPISSLQNQKFPLLTFGHGFVMTWDAYQNIWEMVVPKGYVIIFPKTEGGLSPNHNNFAIDLIFSLQFILDESHQPGSPFYNRLDSMTCLMGHSMGGGAALLAAANSNFVNALLTLAPAETNPSAINAALYDSIPSMIIAGANDCVTPPATNQLPMYNNVASSCKYYASVVGGSHCQMSNFNFLCNLGEATCSPAPTITRSQQHSVIERLMIPFLNYHLKQDCAAQWLLDSLMNNDSSITANYQCTSCITNFHQEYIAVSDIQVAYMNHTLNIYNPKYHSQKIDMTIYSVEGRSEYQFKGTLTTGETIQIPLTHLNKGIHFVRVNTSGKSAVKKIIVY
jgi:hypothetical protein